MQQQEAAVEAMAGLTMEESPESQGSPHQENGSASDEDAAETSGHIVSIEVDTPIKAQGKETPQKHPLQGSQILNTPTLQDHRGASKGTLHKLSLNMELRNPL